MTPQATSTEVWKKIKEMNHLDDDPIYQRAEEIDKEITLHHIEHAFQDIRFMDLEKQAISLSFESSDMHDLVEKFIQKASRIIATHERALYLVHRQEAA